MQQQSRTEFAQALRAIAAERNLDASVILETLKQAMIAAYRRDAKERGEDTDVLEVDVTINPVNGEARVFSWPIDKPEEKKDVTPPGFGRIAAQTAKQVIHQKIREAEKDAVMGEFSARIGALISGMVLRFEGSDVRIDLGKTEGIMPAAERVPNERLTLNQRMTFLLKEIIETLRGKQIVLSRSDIEFVKKLFGREVPEIGSGTVVIKAIVREPGIRTKIAVSSSAIGVDPVGSCVGQKGVRVQAVTNELGGERVDIIAFSENTEEFIKASLSPAEGLTVKLDNRKNIAIVECSSDMLSVAIGKDGQNVRLASKLTGWRIEVKEGKIQSVKKAKEDAQSKKPKESENNKEVKAGTTSQKTQKKAAAIGKTFKVTEKLDKEVKPESELENLEKKENSVSDDRTVKLRKQKANKTEEDKLQSAQNTTEDTKNIKDKMVEEEKPLK